jgi:MoxR-like ATPase
MKSTQYFQLGSFIDYSATKNAKALEKWRRLSSLQEKITRYEELRRWRRIKEKLHVDEILEDLWRIMPPLPSRNVLDMKVKQLFKLLRAKGLTRGREKKITLGVLLFLVLSEENLELHVHLKSKLATHLKISLDNIEDVIRIFKNNIEDSLLHRTFSISDSSLYSGVDSS